MDSILWFDDRAKFNSVAGARDSVVAPVEYRATFSTNGYTGPSIIDGANNLRRGWHPGGFTMTTRVDKPAYGIIDVGGQVFTIHMHSVFYLICVHNNVRVPLQGVSHIFNIFTAPMIDCTYTYAWSKPNDDTQVKLHTPREGDLPLHLFNAGAIAGKQPDGCVFVNSAVWTGWRARNSRSGTVTVTDPRDNSLTTVCNDQFYYRATVFGAFDTYLLAFTDDEPGSFHAFDTRNLAWVGLLDTDRPIRCAHIY